MGIIRQIYQVLQQDGEIKLKIVGHTDSDGDEAMNLELSKRRSQSVKNELNKTFGIDKAILDTDGEGESQPLVLNTSAEGKAKNRRVEFIKL
jgi:outer membrane protein OmpA-like peptidoglycan-associated protein